jgi:hypothetical protein
LYPGITLEIAWLNEPRYDRFRAQLTDMAEHLGIAGRITFSGWKDGAARWDALEGCHGVLQLGSFEETFGLSVIEAVLAGRMALIRPQQAVRDVLGDHPLLLEVADGTCWADIVCDAVPDRPRVAAANRDVRDGLSLSAMVERYDALLKIAC